MKARYGFIGKTLLEKALEKLEDDSFILENKLFWVEQPHRGDYVRGEAFDDYYSLSDVYVYKNTSLEEYLDDLDLDYEELNDYQKMEADMLKNGKVIWFISDHCRGETATSEDEMKSVVKDMLSDGRGVDIYSYDELYDLIKNAIAEEYCPEKEVMFILQKL